MIHIFNDSKVPRLPVKDAVETIKNVFANEKSNIPFNVNVIYTTSEYITELNVQYLGHEGSTDVITFPLGDDDSQLIEGEIYICVPVAAAQAIEYGTKRNNELIRLTAHGALHLCGYDDDTDEKRAAMHELENKYMTK